MSFECDYQILNRFVIGESYNCIAKIIENGGTTNNLINIFGTHQSGRTQESVTFLRIDNQTVTTIPENSGRFLPNLQGIELWNTKLKTVTSKELQSLPQIRIFSSTLNDIEFLEENLFVYNLKLEWIIFNQNKIKTVGGNLFPSTFDLSQITRADFRFNICVVVNVVNRADIDRLLSFRLSEICKDNSSTTSIEPSTTTEITTLSESETTTSTIFTEEPTTITTQDPLPSTSTEIMSSTSSENTESSTISEIDQCSRSCVEFFDSKTDELKKKVENLENIIDGQHKRIAELEKVVKELRCYIIKDILKSTLSGNTDNDDVC